MNLRKYFSTLSSAGRPSPLDFFLIDSWGEELTFGGVGGLPLGIPTYSGSSLYRRGENQLPSPWEQTGFGLATQQLPSLICSLGLHAALGSVFYRISSPKPSLVPALTFDLLSKTDRPLGEVSQQEASLGFSLRVVPWKTDDTPSARIGASPAGAVLAAGGLVRLFFGPLLWSSNSRPWLSAYYCMSEGMDISFLAKIGRAQCPTCHCG